MLKVKVQGFYKSKNNNGFDEVEFNFVKTIPEVPETWINSVVQKRLLPLWIKEHNKKTKTNKPFNDIAFCLISEWEKTDKKDDLSGKDILEMTEYEIQELATKALLIEVPLPNSEPLCSLREKAVIEYLKKVKQVPMKTEADKSKLDFYIKIPDGTWKANLIGKHCFVEDFSIDETDNKTYNEPIKKLTLAELTNSVSVMGE